MFSRKLTEDERRIIRLIESFVRNKHSESDSHDYSHILEVTQYSIMIAGELDEPVEPGMHRMDWSKRLNYPTILLASQYSGTPSG